MIDTQTSCFSSALFCIFGLILSRLLQVLGVCKCEVGCRTRKDIYLCIDNSEVRVLADLPQCQVEVTVPAVRGHKRKGPCTSVFSIRVSETDSEGKSLIRFLKVATKHGSKLTSATPGMNY